MNAAALNSETAPNRGEICDLSWNDAALNRDTVPNRGMIGTRNFYVHVYVCVISFIPIIY